MKIRKTKAQEIQFDTFSVDGEAFILWGKKKIPLSAFRRETVRFVDPERKYWHGMDCTRDLVIHLDKDGEIAVVGKVYE